MRARHRDQTVRDGYGTLYWYCTARCPQARPSVIGTVQYLKSRAAAAITVRQDSTEVQYSRQAGEYRPQGSGIDGARVPRSWQRGVHSRREIVSCSITVRKRAAAVRVLLLLRRRVALRDYEVAV